MHVILWNTRQLDVSKDFAGGYGIGQFPGHGGIRVTLRHFFNRDHRPVSLLYGYLAAIFAKLGHRVEYLEDQPPGAADLYVFHPTLITLSLEHKVIADLLARAAGPRAGRGHGGFGPARGLRRSAGNDRQGRGRATPVALDEVLAKPGATVQLGILEDVDRLPFPDWSLFEPERFGIGYDFWKFPTGLIQASRGCTFKCNYCPYTALDNGNRVRNPEAVVDEMRYGMARWGFRSFKFRDPLFGLNRQMVPRLVELIGHLPRRSNSRSRPASTWCVPRPAAAERRGPDEHHRGH